LQSEKFQAYASYYLRIGKSGTSLPVGDLAGQVVGLTVFGRATTAGPLQTIGAEELTSDARDGGARALLKKRLVFEIGVKLRLLVARAAQFSR
jgi:hypothetical protein